MSNDKWKILTGRICPYCHKPSEFIDSALIYGGQSYGMMYDCRPCDAYVGVHRGTNRALGRLANKELREWKKAAHSFFDPLWKAKMKKRHMQKNVARNLAYEWLAREMGLPKEETHIGMFDVQQCKKVIELCKKYYKK